MIPHIRPRRNRSTESMRALVRETILSPSNFILPLFVTEGKKQRIPITSMPGIFRLSRDLIVAEARRAHKLGISAVALFPVIDEKKKDKRASESKNQDGL